MGDRAMIALDGIPGCIHVVRGQRVILDADLAVLYGVETRTFNQAVRRNLDRFPADFMFRLTPEEYRNLRSQSVISSGHGGRRYTPYAFTEHGAVMAASVLSSQRAVEISVFVVRAFVRLREIVSGHLELARRLDELEDRLTARLDEHDEQIALLFAAIRQLMDGPESPNRRIGFLKSHGPKENT